MRWVDSELIVPTLLLQASVIDKLVTVSLPAGKISLKTKFIPKVENLAPKIEEKTVLLLNKH